ncbi:hypothetical protein GWI72_05340 [Microvirga tunisiensis]|uniref:ASCH domain-containing protein n=1 Tax=Pannonibacter tanglangensis TaxID=2750084 RepID=A0A7X5F0T9_9HYPH|nr:hypothetical protein [Pannonibacter sp. XCT-53]NBN77690.1 hypothetical protein [Pannonibacter sp. XCT-53]
MKVTRGLVIRDPWIEHILQGRKDWEMRAQKTSTRGWFGLIRQGSGTVVGLARLVDCGPALTLDEMIAAHDHHCISEAEIRSGKVARWVIPWKLEDVRKLDRPVPYEHKNGAVTWVKFSDDVAGQLTRVLDEAGSRVDPENAWRATRKVDAAVMTSLSPRPDVAAAAIRPGADRPAGAPTDGPAQLLGRTTLTGGNLRNSHFYIREFLDRFPQECIGGGNRDSAAPRELVIDWGGASPVLSDIDRTKGLFRKRGWVRSFFEASGAREGDTIVVTSPAPYHVDVRVEHRSTPDASDAR